MAFSGLFRNRRNIRAAFLVVLLVLSIPSYVLLIRAFDIQVQPTEEAFLPSPALRQRALSVYAEVMAVDPVRQSMAVKLSPAPAIGLRGVRLSAPDRDLILRIGDGTNERDAIFAANEPMQPITEELDLGGDTIADYPFDVYNLRMQLGAYEGLVLPGEVAPEIPILLKVWDGIPAWIISARSDQVVSDGVKDIGFDVRRAGATEFLAVALYTAMSVIGVAALVIGALVFLGIRRVEATLTSALGAMVFALPALRNIMPGAPPLGVRADFLVFLWAELAVVIGLTLFIWRWVRTGPAP